MAKNGKIKGSAGERELCRFIQKHIPINEVKRNLDQVREGGSDIMSVPGLAIEVKRQEVLAVDEWWKQVVRSAIRTESIPVLAYRQNRRKWFFCVPASLIIPNSWGYITLREEVFVDWLKLYYSKFTN